MISSFNYDKLDNKNSYILGLILLNIDNDINKDDNIICNFKNNINKNDEIVKILESMGKITNNINNIQFILNDIDIINNIKKLIESNDLRYPSYSYMINNNVNHFIEIGPGKVLSGLVKRTSREVKIDTINRQDDIETLKI